MEFVSDVGLGTISTVRKFDKEIQTESSMMSREAQTQISLVHRKYDTIFESITVLDELVSEVLFKKQLMLQFNEGELSDIKLDENGIDQDALSIRMRRITSVEGGWINETPPKSERITSFNTVLQYNKLMDQKLDISIGAKHQPFPANIGNNNLASNLMHIEHQNLQKNDVPLPISSMEIPQPLNRFHMKQAPMFSIKVTKPLSDKQYADQHSADASPVGTPKNTNCEDFVIPCPIIHAGEYFEEIPILLPETPTLGPFVVTQTPPLHRGFTLQINQVDRECENQENEDEARSLAVIHSSPRNILDAEGSSSNVAIKFPNNQGLLDVQLCAAARRSSESIHTQYTHDQQRSHQEIQQSAIKRSLTRDIRSKLESPGVLSLVQQLTFEMNKTNVLATQLQKAKEMISSKDSEIEKYNALITLQKDDLDRKALEIQELIIENERLRTKLGLEKELEDDAIAQPDKKKESKKQKLAKKEENRRLIQDYQQQLGPDQHSRAANQAKNLIALLNKGMFSTFKSPMSLKSVMRTINTLTADRAAEIRQKPETRHQAFSQFVYTYYQQVFGIQQISEKKFTYFVLSLKMYGQYFRVNMFSRFIGLLDGHKVDEELILKYMEALEFMEKNSKGFAIKNKDSAVKILYPFIRADEYCKYFFDGKITSDEIFTFRQTLEKLKEPDPTGMNTGVVDFDVFMDRVLERYHTILNRNKQYVIDAFKACDLDGNNTCTVNEFILLNRYLEPSTFELNGCVKNFFDHADIVDTKETGMSFDRFAIICTNLNLFCEKSQNSFLGISGSTDIEELFTKVKSEWQATYDKLLRCLRDFKTLIPEEVENWENILIVLNQRMEHQDTRDLKPTLIAYFITEKEFTRIKEEDEDTNLSDDDDLVQAMNKKQTETGTSAKSKLEKTDGLEEDNFFSERMKSATKRHTIFKESEAGRKLLCLDLAEDMN